MSDPLDPMDHELKEMEAELRRLRPLDPDFTIYQRLQRELDTPYPSTPTTAPRSTSLAEKIIRWEAQAASPVPVKKVQPWAKVAAVAAVLGTAGGAWWHGHRTAESKVMAESTKASVRSAVSYDTRPAVSALPYHPPSLPARFSSAPVGRYLGASTAPSSTSYTVNQRGWLGIRADDAQHMIPPKMRQDLNLPADTGVIIRTDPSQPAYQSGLRTGDMILSVDGQSTGNALSLMEKVRNEEPGNYLNIVVWRGQEIKSLWVKLGAEPQM